MLGLIDRWSLSSELGSSQTNIVDMLSSTGMGGSLSYKGCGRGPVEPLFFLLIIWLVRLCE